MYCPKCKAEYREGFDMCADCEVPLLAQLPPEPAYTEPVCVFAGDAMQCGLLKGILENAGIPAHQYGIDIPAPHHYVVESGVLRWKIRLFVSGEHAEEARRLVKEFLDMKPLEEEGDQA